jgi:hypothetical protein
MPTIEHFRDLTRSYRWDTAVGADNWRPRDLASLDDRLTRRLIDIMELMLLDAVVPVQMQLLIVVLIPKAAGGERPIGIFPTIMRLLDRWFRWSYGAQWLQRQCLEPFYGQRGRTVEDAIWRGGLLTEWAAASGKCALTQLFDIAKAYEHIGHEKLWNEGMRCGFSATMLCWLLRSFQLRRRLQLEGGLSQEIVARRSVVPGSSFADLAMRIMLTRLVTAARSRWPRAAFAVVVDDIQVTSFGPEGRTRHEALAIADFLKEGLDGLQLPVSVEKLQMVGTSEQFLRSVASRSKLLRQARRRSARNLGADFAPGGPSSTRRGRPAWWKSCGEPSVFAGSAPTAWPG